MLQLCPLCLLARLPVGFSVLQSAVMCLSAPDTTELSHEVTNELGFKALMLPSLLFKQTHGLEPQCSDSTYLGG